MTINNKIKTKKPRNQQKDKVRATMCTAKSRKSCHRASMCFSKKMNRKQHQNETKLEKNDIVGGRVEAKLGPIELLIGYAIN